MKIQNSNTDTEGLKHIKQNYGNRQEIKDVKKLKEEEFEHIIYDIRVKKPKMKRIISKEDDFEDEQLNYEEVRKKNQKRKRTIMK